jgi:hypothetical protein
MTVLGVVIVLGACAKPLEVSSITEIKSTTGSRGIDVLEPKRATLGTTVPEFAGDQLTEVRTYMYKEGEGEIEISGAQCTLSASDFTATMATPAKVRVPLYRAQSSTLAVGCEKEGFEKKLITVAAYDLTRSQRMASSGNGGLVGVLAVAAIDAMADNSRNEWRYPIARVVLEPVKASRPRS